MILNIKKRYIENTLFVKKQNAIENFIKIMNSFFLVSTIYWTFLLQILIAINRLQYLKTKIRENLSFSLYI